MTLANKAEATTTDVHSIHNKAYEQLLVEELKDIYWAEKHLLKSIPVLMRTASDGELYDTLAAHLQQTGVHVTRIQKMFEILGTRAFAKKSAAMAGITEQGNALLDATTPGTTARDAALVFIMQKIEHYEMATYAALAQLATRLDHSSIAELCYTTMEEETIMDELLMEIAEKNIYYRHIA